MGHFSRAIFQKIKWKGFVFHAPRPRPAPGMTLLPLAGWHAMGVPGRAQSNPSTQDSYATLKTIHLLLK